MLHTQRPSNALPYRNPLSWTKNHVISKKSKKGILSEKFIFSIKYQPVASCCLRKGVQTSYSILMNTIRFKITSFDGFLKKRCLIPFNAFFYLTSYISVKITYNDRVGGKGVSWLLDPVKSRLL